MSLIDLAAEEAESRSGARARENSGLAAQILLDKAEAKLVYSMDNLKTGLIILWPRLTITRKRLVANRGAALKSTGPNQETVSDLEFGDTDSKRPLGVGLALGDADSKGLLGFGDSVANLANHLFYESCGESPLAEM